MRVLRAFDVFSAGEKVAVLCLSDVLIDALGNAIIACWLISGCGAG